MTLRQFEIQNICDFSELKSQIQEGGTDLFISACSSSGWGRPTATGSHTPSISPPPPSSSVPVPGCLCIHPMLGSLLCSHSPDRSCLWTTWSLSGEINSLPDTQTPQCSSPASDFLSWLSEAWRLRSAIGDLCFPSARPTYGVILPPPSLSLSCLS